MFGEQPTDANQIVTQLFDDIWEHYARAVIDDHVKCLLGMAGQTHWQLDLLSHRIEHRFHSRFIAAEDSDRQSIRPGQIAPSLLPLLFEDHRLGCDTLLDGKHFAEPVFQARELLELGLLAKLSQPLLNFLEGLFKFLDGLALLARSVTRILLAKAARGLLHRLLGLGDFLLSRLGLAASLTATR